MARKRTKTVTGIKALIAIASFFVTIYFSFSGANHVIHWIASGFENHDAQHACVLILWFLGVTFIIGASLALASLITSIVAMMMGID